MIGIIRDEYETFHRFKASNAVIHGGHLPYLPCMLQNLLVYESMCGEVLVIRKILQYFYTKEISENYLKNLHFLKFFAPIMCKFKSIIAP